MLKVNNLSKEFIRNEKKGKKLPFYAVDDISFEAAEGEILGILGPNGAGKTTLLRMLGKLMKPTKGRVDYVIDKEVIEDATEVKRNIGYLSNNTKMYGRLTVRELLSIAGSIYGMEKTDMELRIEELSRVLDMRAFIDNRIEKLSTGQTQRASIARCLIHNPKLYILDEPTLGLDILSSGAIIDFMKMEKDKNKTVIYSTHYMEEAEYLCDRIMLMDRGRIICHGTMDELKEKTGKNSLRDIFQYLIKENTGDI